MMLRGCLICFSGFSRVEEDSARLIVLELGGEICVNLTKQVTHLIVMQYGTIKCQAAIKIGIPVVSLQWLLDCHSKKCSVAVDSYRAGIFTGRTFSIADVESDSQRSKLIAVIESHGGVYRNSLIRNVTTHLVSVSNHSEKFKFARLWGNVVLVTPNEIFEAYQTNVYAGDSSRSQNFQQSVKEDIEVFLLWLPNRRFFIESDHQENKEIIVNFLLSQQCLHQRILTDEVEMVIVNKDNTLASRLYGLSTLVPKAIFLDEESVLRLIVNGSTSCQL